VTLELAIAPEAGAGVAPRRAPDLVVEAAFDAQRRLTRFTAQGLRVHDAERATLLRAGGDGPGAARLRRAGVGFAPDDASAPARLRAAVAPLARVLGPLTVTGTAFETRDPATALRWRLQATAADGAVYDLVVEPIEGRLVGLSRRGGGQ
jgi:hypothetical protein